MPNADDTAPLPARFIALSRETFDGHHYVAAYHALAAAMHCAADVEDEGVLAEVEGIAYEQLAWIDTHEPMHRLATESSIIRGTGTLWTTLAREARIKRETIALRRAQH